MPNYRRIQTSDSDLNRVQDSTNTVVQEISSGPFIGGKQLTAVAVSASQTSIPHKLRITPTTVILGPSDRDSRVWMPRTPDSNYIYLQASTDCNLFVIWVK